MLVMFPNGKSRTQMGNSSSRVNFTSLFIYLFYDMNIPMVFFYDVSVLSTLPVSVLWDVADSTVWKRAACNFCQYILLLSLSLSLSLHVYFLNHFISFLKTKLVGKQVSQIEQKYVSKLY